MGVAEARKLHEGKLHLEENDLTLLKNWAIDTLAITVKHRHCFWRATSFGAGTIKSLIKLEEKVQAPLYATPGTEGITAESQLTFWQHVAWYEVI